MIAEIIRTCSHEKVAQAAVASMGPSFAGKVGMTAGAQGLTIGAFTARVVRDFQSRSGEEEWNRLRHAMDGADQPILIGLQHILWPAIEKDGQELRVSKQRRTRSNAEGKQHDATAPQQDWKACETPC